MFSQFQPSQFQVQGQARAVYDFMIAKIRSDLSIGIQPSQEELEEIWRVNCRNPTTQGSLNILSEIRSFYNVMALPQDNGEYLQRTGFGIVQKYSQDPERNAVMQSLQQKLNPELEFLAIGYQDQITFLQDQITLAQCVIGYRNKTSNSSSSTRAESVLIEFVNRFTTRLGGPVFMDSK